MIEDERLKEAMPLIQSRLWRHESLDHAITSTAAELELPIQDLQRWVDKAWPDKFFAERQHHQRAKNFERQQAIRAEAQVFAEHFLKRQSERPTPVAVLPLVAFQNWAKRNFENARDQKLAVDAGLLWLKSLNEKKPNA